MEEIKGHDLEDLMKFYLYTGCRRSEPLAIKVASDIDFELGTITIREDVAKSRKARILSFRQLPQLKALIEGMKVEGKLEGKYLFSQTGTTTGKKGAPHDPQTISKRAKAIFRKLNFHPDFRLHDTRTTWANHLLLQGTPITLIQAIGGWESLSTLEKHYSALLTVFSESDIVVTSPY